MVLCVFIEFYLNFLRFFNVLALQIGQMLCFVIILLLWSAQTLKNQRKFNVLALQIGQMLCFVMILLLWSA